MTANREINREFTAIPVKIVDSWRGLTEQIQWLSAKFLGVPEQGLFVGVIRKLFLEEQFVRRSSHMKGLRGLRFLFHRQEVVEPVRRVLSDARGTKMNDSILKLGLAQRPGPPAGAGR